MGFFRFRAASSDEFFRLIQANFEANSEDFVHLKVSGFSGKKKYQGFCLRSFLMFFVQMLGTTTKLVTLLLSYTILLFGNQC